MWQHTVNGKREEENTKKFSFSTNQLVSVLANARCVVPLRRHLRLVSVHQCSVGATANRRRVLVDASFLLIRTHLLHLAEACLGRLAQSPHRAKISCRVQILRWH
jgi:hypothetical protein